MKKSEVYSWRLSPHLKGMLEELARGSGQSMGTLLEGIVSEWIDRSKRKGPRDEEEEMERVRSSALRYVGAIAGGNRRRAEDARQAIRARLRSRHGRQGAH